MAACPCENENPLRSQTALWTGIALVVGSLGYLYWRSQATAAQNVFVTLAPGTQSVKGSKLWIELPAGGRWLFQNGFPATGNAPLSFVLGQPSLVQQFTWLDAANTLQNTTLNITTA